MPSPGKPIALTPPRVQAIRTEIRLACSALTKTDETPFWYAQPIMAAGLQRQCRFPTSGKRQAAAGSGPT
jgi:hypothetical protein